MDPDPRVPHTCESGGSGSGSSTLLFNVFERRYGNTGCRRTYLSGRDLQAHIQHRHHKNNKDDEK
jgi:hypothetical protein